ncbi:hypothetical protein KCMC57_up52950 [Kitasatospora sp. CMC57]|uniref:Uncharacterized protein n=1 Tax=Kitasatospora sp. CMC57 TaxID=3231513 RepID=A0AB33K5G7_9ACTN
MSAELSAGAAEAVAVVPASITSALVNATAMVDMRMRTKGSSSVAAKRAQTDRLGSLGEDPDGLWISSNRCAWKVH